MEKEFLTVPGGGQAATLMLSSCEEAQSGDSGEILPENITGQTKMPLSGCEEEVWGTEKDLDENAYGAAAVALVREGAKIAHELEKGRIQLLTLVRLTFSVGIMVANLALQFSILNYISTYVVEPAVRQVQVSYSQFHMSMFNEDGSIKDNWDDYMYKAEFCQITMADSTFYYLIILLWTLRMLHEVRQIHRFFDEVTSIRGCTLAKHMVEFVETASDSGVVNTDLIGRGRCLITHLTRLMRWILLLFVFLPRTIIACYLLVLGCRWLSASPTFGDMILNALGLVFVTDIDELLYESVLPQTIKKQIADTNWFFIEEPKTRKQVEETEWMLYRRTFGWLVAMTVFLVCYGMFLQTVLPFGLRDVRHHCREFVDLSEQPLCDRWSWFGTSKQCYPYDRNHASAPELVGMR